MHAIIEKAISDNKPANWQVYRGSGSYGCMGMTLAIATIFLLWAVIMLFNLEIAGLLFPVIPLAILLLIAWLAQITEKQKENAVLVISPECVVLGNTTSENIFWLQFKDIQRLKLASRMDVSGYEDSISTTYTYWLDVYSRDGTYCPWNIGKEFQDPCSMYKKIIAMYGHK